MRLGMIASRSFKDPEILTSWEIAYYESLEPGERGVVITGGNKGADTLIRDWCRGRNIDHITMKPYYLLDSTASFNPRHYFVRNRQIIDNSDCIIFLWDGVEDEVSKAIDYAGKRSAGLKAVVMPLYHT